jgi:uncharacterized protein
MLWTAFILGFVGSLHCAGMCGPLAMAVPVVGRGRSAIIRSRLLYNLGRIATYVVMGLIVGLLGEAFALAGVQRWVSLAAGASILIGLFVSGRWLNGFAMNRWIARLKSAFGTLLQRRSHASTLAFGLLNGLLPCGLVYVACTAALASHRWLDGVGYMALFGLGTLPMMFGFGLIGVKFQNVIRVRLQKLVPVSLAVVGGLLLLRGLALGVPYLSPADPQQSGAVCPLCAR